MDARILFACSVIAEPEDCLTLWETTRPDAPMVKATVTEPSPRLEVPLVCFLISAVKARK